MNIKGFTTGVQHIGIPTNDINKTIEFYEALGFNIAYRTVNGAEEVAFLQLHNLMIETYQNYQAKMEYGAIDHIAIDVKNIEDLHHARQSSKRSSILGEWREVLYHRRS